MIAQLRSELLKLRTTRTNLGLGAGMLALVLAAVFLHGLAVPVGRLSSRPDQLALVFGWAQLMGSLFAALLGALSITGEFRHGTVRPTFLVTPQRGRVVAAKVFGTMLVGAGFGAIASVVAITAGSAVLALRGVEIATTSEDYLLLLGGCAVSAALWAAIGVGLGAVVRKQVPVVVGLCAWMLFVEQLLLGDILGSVGRYTPGALSRAAAIESTSVSPIVAILFLSLYAISIATAGGLATSRRDVA